MHAGYIALGAVEMGRKLGRTGQSVRLKAQHLGIVRANYRAVFNDCNGEPILPGDVVTLVGQKTRATVMQLVRRGVHRGTVLLDPPLRYSHHGPEELERIARQPRNVVEAMPEAQPDTVLFNAWLRGGRVTL